jgi:hypothetical protein
MNYLKFCLLFLFSFTLVFLLKAQEGKVLGKDTLWRYYGLASFNLGQYSFTNWAAGGENNVNINSVLFLRMRYHRDKVSWENIWDAKYGTVINGKLEPKKTDDKLKFTSKYSFEASDHWRYSYLLDFRTQFTNGYNYPNDSIPISSFMAPAYFLVGVGMDWIPNKFLSVLISPVTYKVTIVNNQELANEGMFGVEKAVYDDLGRIIKPGKRIKNEPGAYIKFFYQEEFENGLSLNSRAEFFTAFHVWPIQTDVVWATLINYKISRYFSVIFTLDLVWDKDIIIMQDTNGDGVKEVLGPRLQAKQSFGLGLSYQIK